MGRVSDDTREQTVAVLRHGLVDGRLGTETFIARVDAAYQAKTHDELAVVTDDLPRHRRLWGAVIDWVVPRPQSAPLVRLRPPEMAEGDRRVMGRAATCDYAIADQTVSARHAELVRVDGGWLIRDLDSRNGTRVNGWLVKEQRLEPGDTLTLGTTVFVFEGV